MAYESHNGNLEYKACIKLDSPLVDALKVLSGNSEIKYELSETKDNLSVWLPLIGDNTVISLKNGSKTISSYTVAAPVSSDWGYFAGGTIHIIQSSHQDIAWVNTPEFCRRDRIDNTIIPALEMMKENPGFTFEMEQTLNLMEFLDEHPERKDEIIQRYDEGRFFWGATFNQPYEGLSSGEQLVRQAYFGRKWIKENLPGCDDKTASNIDVPGRTLQMPQILSKCGIENLFISRMREGLYNWYSPDGSKVFTFTPGNYGWATLMWHFFDNGAVPAMRKLKDRLALWDDYFRERKIPPHYAILISCDATKPVDFTPVINEWNAIAGQSGGRLPYLTTSVSEKYFEAVNVPGAELETVSGERPDLWLYIHGPAHYQQTLAKRESAIMLPDAEMFSSVAELVNDSHKYDRKTLDRGWLASIYPDHGLGGNFGDVTDSIFTDSLVNARNIGAKMFNKAIADIAAEVKTCNRSVVVFNDLTWERGGMAEMALPAGVEFVKIYDDADNLLPVQYKDKNGERTACFYADNIPSAGYKSFRYTAVKKNRPDQDVADVNYGGNYYENRYYKIILGNGGIVSLIDKNTGRDIVQKEKFAFGDVLELGYNGNGAGEFTRITDPVPGDISCLKNYASEWDIVENGPLYIAYENVQATNNTVIRQRFTFYHNVKKIDLDITLENFNGAHNRQYRVAFPLDMKHDEAAIEYEVPMAVLHVGEDEMKTIPGGWSWGGTYVFHPADSHPREIQNFMSASGNGIGFTMSSPVAVGDWIDPSREQSDYPVMQGILLSSHHSCHGSGNWYHQTGTHSFHFSVLSHEEGWKNGYKYGIEANRPLVCVLKEGSKGSIPSSGSFISLSDPFVSVNAFKKADNGDGYILRLTEMEGVDKTVTVTFPFEVKEIRKCNMIEEDMEPIAGCGQTVDFELGHHSIETFKLK